MCRPAAPRIAEFGERGVVAVALLDFAKERVVPLPGGGASRREHVPAPDERLRRSTDVGPPRVPRLHVGQAGGREHGARHRAAFAVLDGHAAGEKRRSTAPVLPEDARPRHPAGIARDVGPSIVVAIVLGLPVAAGEERPAPALARRHGREEHGVGGAQSGPVDEQVDGPLLGGPSRDQVHDPAHGARAIERGGDTLDHLHLPEVHRRDLQQAQAADLLPEEGQPVAEEPRVAALHALHADAGGAERRRGGLHAHAAHLVEHHDDVAGRHEHLLFDFLADQHLDPGGLVGEASAGPRGGDDHHVFLQVRRFDQRNGDRHLAPRVEHQVLGRLEKSFLGDREPGAAGGR